MDKQGMPVSQGQRFPLMQQDAWTQTSYPHPDFNS